nr:hypothetical protein [Gemmatimonadota bacterium]NIS00803.1 hypothetical protein [Gemmatimonadota bacterium]NIT68362.1 hypothetical protein [Gemmatimonadota bacterium]NIW75258.1 hypothetical protein [Gemmatimonadota bacterium]NIY36939.1 hypothetical protein [Gemmatimonadota bacterium]
MERPDVDALRTQFADAVRSLERDAAGEPVIYVDPERNVEVLEYLRDSQGYDMLKDVTGLDRGGGSPIQ